MFKNPSVRQVLILALIGVVIIIAVPHIIVATFPEKFLGTGQMGDTLGGLTAPFIGLFSAILVYVAFKEQVKSNELLRGQITFEMVQDQIEMLEAFVPRLRSHVKRLLDGYSGENLPDKVRVKQDYPKVNYWHEAADTKEIIYHLNIFLLCFDAMKNLEKTQQDFVERQLVWLYDKQYQPVKEFYMWSVGKDEENVNDIQTLSDFQDTWFQVQSRVEGSAHSDLVKRVIKDTVPQTS